MKTLYLHVGYPKTATTTFQKHLFPAHPQIDYLGKFCPSYGYRSDALATEINRLISADDVDYDAGATLKTIIDPLRRQSKADRTLLLSSESFIHPWANNRGIIARRIKDALQPCRILITIREQIDIIRSFYNLHGRFGQYLFLCKDREPLEFPLPFDRWLHYCLQEFDRNFLATIQYHQVISFYASVFGHENVCVLLFEQFVQDKPGYVEDLCRFLQIDDFDTALTLLGDSHELRSAPLVQSPPQPPATPLTAFARRLPSTFQRKPAEHTPAVIDDGARSQLAELYRLGNRTLMRDFQVPLDQFGYLI